MSDDLPQRQSSTRLTILPFDATSVAELESYIVQLRAEIDRAQAAIIRKKAHLGAADLVFGRPADLP